MTLAAFSIVDVLDVAVRWYRKRWITHLSIVAITLLPVSIPFCFAILNSRTSWVFITFVLYLFVCRPLTATALVLVNAHVVEGILFTTGQIIAQTLRWSVRVVVVGIVPNLLGACVGLLATAVMVLGSILGQSLLFPGPPNDFARPVFFNANALWIAAVTLFIGLVAAWFVVSATHARLLFLGPIMVWEDRNALEVFKRSWLLSGYAVWRTQLAYLLVSFLTNLLPLCLFILCFLVPYFLLDNPPLNKLLGEIQPWGIVSVWTILLIVLPLQQAAYSLLYIVYRMRYEAADMIDFELED